MRNRVAVDGVTYTDDVEPRTLLVQYLRYELQGKIGTLVGCDTTNCGSCTVHLNGLSVKSCTVLAVQADGCDVTTIEGLASDGELHASCSRPSTRTTHCSAWFSWKACCTEWFPHRWQGPRWWSRRIRPAWTASTVHDFTLSPLRWTVPLPQLVVSHPTSVPSLP